MEKTCTVPIDLKVDENGKPYYIMCGEPAVSISKKDSNWCFCAAHATAAGEEKNSYGELESIEEKVYEEENKENGSRC